VNIQISVCSASSFECPPCQALPGPPVIEEKTDGCSCVAVHPWGHKRKVKKPASIN
jgi:hypothetical protein